MYTKQTFQKNILDGKGDDLMNCKKCQLTIAIGLLLTLIIFAGCFHPQSICGNGVCEAGENPENCPSENGGDCPPINFCGNGICDMNIGENEKNCAEDCLKFVKECIDLKYAVFPESVGKMIFSEKLISDNPPIIAINNGESARISNNINLVVKINDQNYFVPSEFFKLTIRESGGVYPNGDFPILFDGNTVTGKSKIFDDYNSNWAYFSVTSDCEYLRSYLTKQEEANFFVMVGNVYKGNSVVFVFPNYSYGTFTMKDFFNSYNMVKIFDYSHSIMQETTGFAPYNRGFTPIALNNEACGWVTGDDNPVVLGPGCFTVRFSEDPVAAKGLDFANLLIDGEKAASSPHTVGHELGHKFASRLEKIFSKDGRFVEIFNNDLYYYSFVKILENQNKYPLDNYSKNLVEYVVKSRKNLWRPSLDYYLLKPQMRSGFYNAISEHAEPMNALFQHISENPALNDYGVEFYVRFFSLVSKDSTTIDSQEQASTYIVAGMSVASGHDLKEFMREYGFPINDTYYTEIIKNLSEIA
jgi:hypothetical protein